MYAGLKTFVLIVSLADLKDTFDDGVGKIDLQFTDMMTLYGLDGWELVFARRAIIESVAQPNACRL